MDMQTFFSKCGSLKGWNHETQAQGATNRHIVHFYYDNGHASYDGREWTYTLARGG